MIIVPQNGQKNNPRHRGETVTGHQFQSCRRADPRRCGENRSGKKAGTPRNRNHTQSDGVRQSRFTPAVAGETRPRQRRTLQQGPSPRTRGRLRLKDGREDAAGPIPADAGKTRFGQPSFQPFAADPRSHGEDTDFPFAWSQQCGPSPQPRGKHYCVCIIEETSWPIPADAGKTKS